METHGCVIGCLPLAFSKPAAAKTSPGYKGKVEMCRGVLPDLDLLYSCETFCKPL